MTRKKERRKHLSETSSKKKKKVYILGKKVYVLKKETNKEKKNENTRHERIELQGVRDLCAMNLGAQIPIFVILLKYNNDIYALA